MSDKSSSPRRSCLRLGGSTRHRCPCRLSLLASAAGGRPQFVPSSVNVPEEALVDLRRRIAATRWPDRETVNDQSQGIQLAKLQQLVRYWGTGYDWRKAEAKLNALPQFMTTIDWRGHSLHPRPLASSERHAADHDAWLARLGVRAAQDRRSAHRSHRAWRTRGRRLRSGHAFDARLRLLRQADGHRLGSRPHRANLGGADEAPRLHPLRRPGRRLGLPRLQRDGAPGAGRLARHPHQLAGGRAARGGRGARRRRARAGGTLREGTRDVRRAQRGRQDGEQVLRRDDGHPAADDRLRHNGLPGRPRGVDARASRFTLDVRAAIPKSPRTRCWTTSRCTG